MYLLVKRKSTEARKITKEEFTIINRIGEMLVSWYGYFIRINHKRITNIIMDCEQPSKK